MMPTLREASKDTWNSKDTLDEINAGSLQRIADATETMAKSYNWMEDDRNWYRDAFREEQDKVCRFKRRVSALRGVITKLKKAADNAKEN